MTVDIKSYRFDLPPPAFTETNYDKGHWDIIYTTDVDLKDYPDLHECLGVEAIINERIYNGDNYNFLAVYTNIATGEEIFRSVQTVPDPSTEGYTYFTKYRIVSWIGHCDWEIDGPMNIRINVLVRKNITPLLGGVKQFIMEVIETIKPPPGECPDFWEDPIGWTLCTITNGFSVFAEWFGTSFWSFIADMGIWLARFSLEFKLFLRNPAKYINDAIRGFLIDQEQNLATDYMELRKNEEDHWISGTDWIAGQYKTVDDLTDAEFQLLIDKGLTDNKEALRAADFRVYKLDASSKAALETTMSTLRSEIGGLWFGIDTKTSELLDVFNVGHTYLVNFVETIESNLPDTIGDIIQGIGSFVSGGFLDFDTWALQFGLDVAGYTDSKILDVKEWFNISLPELIGDMFDWAKPVIQPIMDAVGFLGQIIGIVTGTAPESESVKAVKENYKTQTDRINDILGRP